MGNFAENLNLGNRFRPPLREPFPLSNIIPQRCSDTNKPAKVPTVVLQRVCSILPNTHEQCRV